MPFIEHTSNDLDLISQYKGSGSLDILGALYKPYMDMVYGVCLKYLGDREAAQDAVMAIFEELIVKVKKHTILNFKPWLYQVAKNYCLMQLRSQKKYNVVPIDYAPMQLEHISHQDNEVWEKENRLTQLERCIEQLQQEQRNIVSLFYLQGNSYQQIVETTGMDWGAVKSAIQNGRRNLKNCMEKSE